MQSLALAVPTQTRRKIFRLPRPRGGRPGGILFGMLAGPSGRWRLGRAGLYVELLARQRGLGLLGSLFLQRYGIGLVLGRLLVQQGD
jgi:hypothetical protein